MADENLQQSIPDIKSIRESKGMTLRDICEITKISVSYLQSIENEDFHLLPPPVYTKTFIKKYAETVGIESSLLLGRYEKYLAADKKPAEPGKAEKKGLIGKSIYKSAGALIILVAGAVFIVSLLSSNRNAKNTEEQKYSVVESKPPAVQIVNPAVTAPALPVKDETAGKVDSQIVAGKDNIKAAEKTIKSPAKDESIDKSPPAKDKPVSKTDARNGEMAEKLYVLSVEAKELTWIRITDDNNRKPYQILLKTGDKIKRSAAKSFLIDVGNAGGVDIFFQGKPVGVLGKQGEVVHLRLP